MSMTRINKKAGFPLIAIFSLTLLSSCKAADTPLVGTAIDSMAGKKAATELRLSTAAAEASARGETAEALRQYEKLYAKNKNDRDIALNYAQLLRKTGNPQRAMIILSPFLLDKEGKEQRKIDPLLLNEYAAVEIELGNLDHATHLADRVLSNAKAPEFHADAKHLKGVALDAQGKHSAAEEMFRQSMESWKGDPTSVMNNLALSLAAQGKFDESLTMLRKALVMAPGKQDIARNIQFVETLRDTIVPKAPIDIKNGK